jgi:hypothetical protein
MANFVFPSLPAWYLLARERGSLKTRAAYNASDGTTFVLSCQCLDAGLS